jgi:hypothetical protein
MTEEPEVEGSVTKADTHLEISEYCEEIAKLFRPGAKVSVIVRNPSFDRTPHSASMLVTLDDIGEISGALEYLKTRPDV